MTRKKQNYELIGRGIVRAWWGDDDSEWDCCQDCGRLIDWDMQGLGDDIVQPGYVTASGDVFCRQCGVQYDRREESMLDDEWDGVVEVDEIEQEYELCPICGAEKSEWEECWQIGCEDGWITDLYESDPMWYDEDDIEMCGECQGKGGWWICPNLPHPEAGTLQASAEGGAE